MEKEDNREEEQEFVRKRNLFTDSKNKIWKSGEEDSEENRTN